MALRLEESPVGGHGSRLSLAALGISLTVLVSAAWGTGFLYLLARAGLASPVRLAVVDGIHAYSGVAGAVVIGAKVWRVGFRRRVPGVSGVVLWQRWMSLSMLVLYAASFGTGVLAALPIGPVRAGAVQAHLLTSVWALAPTTWHVWHYRARALPLLARMRSRGRPRRILAGIALMTLPSLLALAAPRALSAAAAAGAGSSWRASGLQGVQISRITATPDGRTLLAAGDGVYLSSDGTHWRSVGLPSGGPEADRLIEIGIRPPAGAPAAGPAAASEHGGHAAGAVAGSVLAVAMAPAGNRFLLGATDGIYFSPWPEGPYSQLPFPGGMVRSLSMDPANPYVIWAASAGGPHLTIDGGHTWSRFASGLAAPERAATVTQLQGEVYLSDLTGVYRWDAGTASWALSSDQRLVTSLDPGPGGSLYASGHLDGVRVLRKGRWQAASGLTHAHGRTGSHTGTISFTGGRVLAAGSQVQAMPEAGGSWLGLGSLPAYANSVLTGTDRIYAATDDGVYAYPLAAAVPPGMVWILVVALGAAGLAVVGTTIGRRPKPAGQFPGLRSIRG